MTLPLISIVVCTYNGEAFIKAQVDSLFAQTYPHLEIIVSDDASTDGTIAILQGFTQHKNFQLHQQPQNIGYIENFQWALQQATGEYIVLCDQDDIWLPEKITQLYNHIGAFSLCYGDSLLIDEGGVSLGKTLSGLRHMYSGKESYGFVFFNVVWGHALLIPRSLLATALPIPQSIPHDIWLAYKAVTENGIRYIDEVHTHYRQHTGAYTTTLLPKHLPSRTYSKRYLAYQKQLHWIKTMRDYAVNREKEFYNQLYALYELSGDGRFNTKLFLFLFKHQEKLYRFSRKNFVSRLIDMRKRSRGEKEG